MPFSLCTCPSSTAPTGRFGHSAMATVYFGRTSALDAGPEIACCCDPVALRALRKHLVPVNKADETCEGKYVLHEKHHFTSLEVWEDGTYMYEDTSGKPVSGIPTCSARPRKFSS